MVELRSDEKEEQQNDELGLRRGWRAVRSGEVEEAGAGEKRATIGKEIVERMKTL